MSSSSTSSSKTTSTTRRGTSPSGSASSTHPNPSDLPSPTFPPGPAGTDIGPTGGPSGGPNGRQNGQQQGDMQTSATLYLYTFLATLILLLGVSAAIVLRSLLLRRRHRRMIEEAIRNGTWVPPRENRKVDLSKKPKLWDVYLHNPENEKSEAGWDILMPFSVSNVSSGKEKDAASTAASQSASSLSAVAPPRRNIFARTFRRGARESDVELSQQNSNSSSTAMTSGDAELSLKNPVQISVLIAMPSPTPLHKLISQARALGDDEAELPYVEVGIAQQLPLEKDSSSSLILNDTAGSS